MSNRKQSEEDPLDAGFWASGPNSSVKYKVEEGMWLYPPEAEAVNKKSKKDKTEPAKCEKKYEDTKEKKTETIKRKADIQPDSVSNSKKRKDMDSKTTKNNIVSSKPKTVDTSLSTVDNLRDEFESGTEWGMRSQFLKAHLNSMPLDRLICLSKCFINHEIGGNRYPEPVMNKLQTMRLAIADSIMDPKERLKSQFEVTFVKPSETETKPKNPNKAIEHQTKKPTNKKGNINFVKAGSTYESINYAKTQEDTPEESTEKQTYHPGLVPCHKTDEGFAKPQSDPEDYKSLYDKMQGRKEIQRQEECFRFLSLELQKLEKKKSETNCISKLFEAAQKIKIVPHSEIECGSAEEGFICEVLIEGVLICQACGKSKKLARTNAFTLANTLLTKSYIKLLGTHPDDVTFWSSDEPHPSDTAASSTTNDVTKSDTKEVKEKKQNVECNLRELRFFKKHFKNFYIRELNRQALDNPIQGLRISCDYHKLLLETKTLNPWKNGKVKAILSINGMEVGDGADENFKMAEIEAATVAFEKFRNVFWTMQYKTQVDADEDKMRKDTMLEGKTESIAEFKHGKKLGDSNIGSKLMKKMGWNGGGIGKNQQGREEPVLVDKIVERSGLGSASSTSKELENVLTKIVQDYCHSDQDTDLAFAPDFTNVERKFIHQICRKYHLQSKSYGTGEERYLVISRHRTPKELFDYVLAKGCETTKYKLIPPKIDEFR